MKQNVIAIALAKAQSHIEAAIPTTDTKENKRKVYEKLTKAALIDMLLENEKFEAVKIEDIARPILEDPECAWLDYATIAGLIRSAISGAKTSDKSIASYASKYPTAKGWEVKPRKSASARNAELMKIIGG